MNRRADSLRYIAARLKLPTLREVVRQPGMSEGYRVTIAYHDYRLPDQVATLTRADNGAVTLEMALNQVYSAPTMRYPFAPERFRSLDRALRRLRFDRLDDQPDIPLSGVDLWLIERMSGSYFHDVVIAPALAEGVHADIWEALMINLPEAVKITVGAA